MPCVFRYLHVLYTLVDTLNGVSRWRASVAQLVEHRSRKAGVTGSSPVAGSIDYLASQQWEAFFFSLTRSVSPKPRNRMVNCGDGSITQ